MHTINHGNHAIGDHAAVAAGLAALFTVAVVGAKLVADAVIYVGMLLIR